MGTFANVKRITVMTEKGEITFRSKLEYRWYIWCQLRKEQGLIQDWFYEDPETLLMLEQEYMNNKRGYLPDFTILTNEGEYEYEELKGYFPPKDYTKIKLASEQYENPITLIFASLLPDSRNSKTRAQRRRAERIEPHIKRVIYDAKKTIFEPIKHLFDY
jgi:hypothetical protein